MANLWNDVTNRVMRLANREADRLRHDYIGTEHILMALLRLPDHAAAQALAAAGIELRHVRMEVEKIVHSGPENTWMPKVRPLTPRAKVVLRFSVESADKLGKTEVDTGHLLCGLVWEQEGVASQILRLLGFVGEGVPPDGIRERIGRHTDAIQAAPGKAYGGAEPDFDWKPQPPARPPRIEKAPGAAEPTRPIVRRRAGPWGLWVASFCLSAGLLVALLVWEVELFLAMAAAAMTCLFLLVTVAWVAVSVWREAEGGFARKAFEQSLRRGTLSGKRGELARDLEARFGRLDEVTRGRIQTWDDDQLAEATRRLAAGARSLEELGLSEE
jgi:hypothetical protein